MLEFTIYQKATQSPTWAFLINKWGFYCQKEVYPIKLLAKGATWEPPKQPRLLPRLLIVRHKLTEDRTYISRWTQTCQVGGYLEPLPQQTTVHGRWRYSSCYQRRDVNTNPATNPIIYISDLSAKYVGASAAQSLCEELINIWLVFGHTSWNGTYTNTAWVAKQKPEIRSAGNLGEN